MSPPRRAWPAPFVLLGALCGCGDSSPATGAPSRPATEQGLKALFEEFRAHRVAGRGDDALRVGKEMLPTRDELRAIVRAGPDAEAWLAAYRGTTAEHAPTKAPGPLSEAASKQTEIRIHAATTEEIAAYVEGTVAWKEFPGGMRAFAEKVAAPGRTWYVVEVREPGKASGTRFTCLTHIGGRFVTVAKPWRAIPTPPDARPTATSDEPEEAK